MSKCNLKTEVYSRVCGYHRPVGNWNEGKRSEFKDRVAFDVKRAGAVAARPGKRDEQATSIA